MKGIKKMKKKRKKNKLLVEEREKEKAQKLFQQQVERELKQEAKEKELKLKIEEKSKEKEKIEKQHKLKSSRGDVFCIYCGSLEGEIYTYSYCDGRKNGHNYVFMKDKKDRWHIKCNKCGADRSDSNYSCS